MNGVNLMIRRFRKDEISEMADVILRNGVISVPTDTVYGLCARYDSKDAQEHLRDIKQRPKDKAFPLMCADAEQIRSVACTDEISEALIRGLMPGPVTLILKKRDTVADYVNGGMDTLAVRMATDDTLKQLIRAVGRPVYMTSANLSGQPVCRSLDEIKEACPDLDGMLEGETAFGRASTIIDCTKEKPVILREGPVQFETVMRIYENTKG